MSDPRETSFYVDPTKRSIVLPGLAADKFYNLAVRGYRRVDKDINASGVIFSELTRAKSWRYQPSTTVAFNGDVTGTIQGVSSLQVITDLHAITSDGVLSRPEKQQVVIAWSNLHSQMDAAASKANQLGGLDSFVASAAAALAALDTYLGQLAPAWNDLGKDTPVDPETFQNAFAAAQAQVADLIAMTVDRASQLANWTGVTGPGKPQDNATVGAPVGTHVGDVPVVNIVDAVKGIDGSILKIRDISSQVEAAQSQAAAARSEVAEARADLNASVASVRSDLDNTRTELGTVRSDVTKVATDAKDQADAARAEVSQARSDLSAVQGDLATARSDLSAETQRAKDDASAIRQDIASVKQVSDGASAAVKDEALARAREDSALSGRLQTIEADYVTSGHANNIAQAKVSDEASARAREDGALSDRISTTESRFTQTPVSFTAVSRGLNGSNPSGREAGIYDGAGNRIWPAYGMWNVVTFDDQNRIDQGYHFDTLNSATDRQNMANFLMSRPAGKTVVCFTSDEPATNRFDTSAGLVAALERVGAGPLYHSDKFRFRGAYVLIGRAGVGSGNGVEAYAGSQDSAEDAWVEQRLDLLRGIPSLNSAARASAEAIAKVGEEATTRAGNDSALSGRIQTIESDYVTNGAANNIAQAKVNDEASTRAREDSAIAGRVSATEADYSRLAKIADRQLPFSFEDSGQFSFYEGVFQGGSNWQLAKNRDGRSYLTALGAGATYGIVRHRATLPAGAGEVVRATLVGQKGGNNPSDPRVNIRLCYDRPGVGRVIVASSGDTQLTDAQRFDTNTYATNSVEFTMPFAADVYAEYYLGFAGGAIDVYEAHLEIVTALVKTNAKISEEATARADAVSSVAGRTDKVEARVGSLEGQVGGHNSTEIVARLEREETASATRDSALGGRIDNVIADYRNADSATNSRVDTEITTRSDAVKAVANRAEQIAASFNRSQLEKLPVDFAGGDADWNRTTAGSGSSWVYYEDTRPKNDWSKTDGTVITGVHQPNGYLYLFPRRDPIPVSAGDVVRLYASVGAYGVCEANVYFDTRNRAGEVTPNSWNSGTMRTPDGYNNTHAGNGEYKTIAVEWVVPDGVSFVIPAFVSNAHDFAGPLFVRWMKFENANGVSKVNARVSDEATASSSRDSALSGRIQTIEADYVTSGHAGNIAQAKVNDEATARAREDGALANRIQTVETSSRSSGNLVPNSELSSLDGWIVTWNAAGLGALAVQTDDYWNPRGGSCLTMSRGGVPPSGSFTEVQSAKFPVTGNSIIQFYARTASHRARSWTSIFFRDENGNDAGYAGEWFGDRINNGGPDLNGWDYTGKKFHQVPANARSAVFVWRIYETQGAENPQGWMFQPYVGLARDGQTEWNAYSPGSSRSVLVATNTRITDEATASSNRDSALGGRVQTIESDYVTNGAANNIAQAKVNDEASTRAREDSAISNRVSSTEARFQGTPLTFTARSYGNGASTSPFGFTAGLWDGNGTHLAAVGRSYGVFVFDGSNNLIAANTYDVYGNGEAASGRGWGAMRDFLNGITAGQAVIVVTADEPRNNRGNDGLREAMERCGAGDLFFNPANTDTFKSHSAYILIGRAGIGRGNGTEYYRGAVDVDPGAWLEVNFQMLRGMPSVGNAGMQAAITTARVAAEETARSNGDSANANRIQNLETQMNLGSDSNMYARIRQEETARANAVSSVAGRTDVLEARASATASNVKNDNFAMWSNGGGLPDFWGPWNTQGNYRTERWSANSGSPWAIKTLNDALGAESGFCQAVTTYPGKWVVEVTAQCNANEMSGAGVTLSGVYNLDFISDPDTNGLTGNQGDKIRTWVKMFDIGDHGSLNVHAMLGWTGFGRTIVPKSVTWFRLVLRPAGPGDIGAQKNSAAIVEANARIGREETARADAVSSVANRTGTLEANYNSVRNDLNNWNNDRYQDNLRTDARVAREETARADAISAVSNRTSTVEAQISNDSNNMLRNGIFNAPGWGRGSNGPPPSWRVWSQDNGAYIGWTDRQSMFGGPCPLQIDRNGLNNGVAQDLPGPIPPGWYAFEVDVIGEDGNWSGAGVHCNFNNGSSFNFGFGINNDTAGRYGDIGTAARRFTWLFYNASNSNGASLYLMAGWEGFQGSTNFGFLRSVWHRIVMRPASEGEIQARKVADSNLISRVSQTESAVANINGKVAAYWQVQAVAGNNRAQMTVHADANGGAGVDIVGDVRFSGGNANGTCIVNGNGLNLYYANGQQAVRLSI